MIYEHRVSKRFYFEPAFRSFTNSYRLHQTQLCTGDCDAKRFIRIDENQLAFFADYYFSKRIVLNIEAGHSIFRKIREGAKGGKTAGYKIVLTEKDNFYGRVMLAYRMRFREMFQSSFLIQYHIWIKQIKRNATVVVVFKKMFYYFWNHVFKMYFRHIVLHPFCKMGSEIIINSRQHFCSEGF